MTTFQANRLAAVQPRHGNIVGYIKLIHWKEEEAAERAERIAVCGYEVDSETPRDDAAVRVLSKSPPQAVVIDLSRLPSHGRDVALALRSSPATRHVPIVFVEGEPEKVARTKALLPDATYTRWTRIKTSLKKALANPPANPVVPDSVMAGYAGTPLPKKLGIKAGSTLVLLNAPDSFRDTLGSLPDGVTIKSTARGRRELTVWFPKSARDLEDRIDRLADQVEGGGLWIAWPKQASGVKTDITQAIVRQVGLAAGLVDFKICSIDATWSGLKFARRRIK
jgi:CheY-like chemotaxis protein